MRLVPRELDKLILHQTGRLAQERLARGLPLNLIEATALIASVCSELIRDGNYSVAQLMQVGRELLGFRQVLPAVMHLLVEVQVEGCFPDGSKLVTIHNPICSENGNLELALYGSFLPTPNLDKFPKHIMMAHSDLPGAFLITPGDIEINAGRHRLSIRVVNDGDRPIQVGSHYPFIETNPQLRFDRVLAYGKRLDIPAGTAVRFEPGDTKIVHLVEIAGHKIIKGGNNLATGLVDMGKIPRILQTLEERGFKHEPMRDAMVIPPPYTLSRQRYASLYGPTAGDRVRLGDSSLIIEIEKDYTHYGDESVFGGGKVIRDGMGQKSGCHENDALDLVITNAIIIDWSGIVKADIGIKNGFIVGIGKSGNPDIMAGVTPGMIIGVTTEVLSAKGQIITAGGLDTHVHFICPQICYESLSSGMTTLVGGGTGPNTGTNATTCTPGSFNLKMMLKSTDDIPMNFGFTGKGNCSSFEGLKEQAEAGVVGLKLHEDWGTTPAAIDACLTICDQYDLQARSSVYKARFFINVQRQATIHTDTLNESGFVETTIEAFKGRTIHAYHTEGAGGGHAPDIITVVSLPNVIPSSTNPTRPYTINTLDEHLDMLLVCHHLDKTVPEDIAFAESRIRGETIGAEDILHDMGAISIISSDSQAMGRAGEVISRTWQTADKMKKMRGYLSQDGETEAEGKADNFRVKRYVSKYTINPAIAHGLSHMVGSVEKGKFADLVMFKPHSFGTKPELIIKGGQIVWAMMGDANASIPTPEPVISRKMFGAYASNLGTNCLVFVSKVSITNGKVSSYKLRKRVEPVKNCRKISKKDMKWNDSTPVVKVDPETYCVTVDGVQADMAPATEVCMGQSAYLF